MSLLVAFLVVFWSISQIYWLNKSSFDPIIADRDLVLLMLLGPLGFFYYVWLERTS